jgi:hypothetical protein
VDELITWMRAQLDVEQADVDPYLRDPFEGLSDDERHQRHAHPAYEYRTTEGQRKAWPWVDDPPEGDGWELNITSRDPDAFERFDYTEERYWRRLEPGGASEWKPAPVNARRAADIAAKRRMLDGLAPIVVDHVYTDDGELPLAEWMVRMLALPFSDRPGYREEWRPHA